jgi:ectoine hydroxylase-related dioxygenase (phytanoyl-CoA dioxygenase family)
MNARLGCLLAAACVLAARGAPAACPAAASGLDASRAARWTSKEVALWLQMQKLPGAALHAAELGLDGTVVDELMRGAPSDLEELGVQKRGDQSALVRAWTALAACAPPHNPDPASPGTTSSAGAHPAADEAGARMLDAVVARAFRAGLFPAGLDASRVLRSRTVRKAFRRLAAGDTSELGTRAIEVAERGRLLESIPLFAAAVDASPSDATSWTNLAVTLMRVAQQAGARSKKRASHWLTRAWLAVHTAKALVLGIDALSRDVEENMAPIARTATAMGVALEPVDLTAGGRFPPEAELRRVREERDARGYADVRGTCDEDSVRVRFHAEQAPATDATATDAVTAREKPQDWGQPQHPDAPLFGFHSGIAQMRALRRAIGIFRVCGVVVVEGALRGAFLREVQAAQAEVTRAYLAEAERDVTKFDYTAGKITSEGRYLVHLPFEPPISDERLLAAPAVLPLLRTLIADGRYEFEVGDLSVVTSMPRTPAQHMHNDTGQVFKHDPRWKAHRANVHAAARRASRAGRRAHDRASSVGWTGVPPHGIISFWPMLDMRAEHGPTRFVCGTHVECFASEEECERRTKTIAPTADAGAAILFDMRLKHAGGENRSDVQRPVLYITYVRPWYKDYVNFHNRQTRRFDGFPPHYKRATTRLDSEAYVRELERRLREMGVDPLELQSRYEYNPLNFVHREHGGKYKMLT